MKKISLIVMSCIIACGLLANHGIVKGGEMSPKVEDTVSIDKKITDSQWLSNNSDMLEVDTAGEDSVVNVVAYFCKGDTCEYWIYENEWKVNGKDTVKTLGVSTQVRLVVNDSTSKGYKMSYTFLDVKADSVGDNFRDKMMAMIAERTAKSVIGTTINFETDEYGSITKITNLSQIKKQAKALFKASMKDIASMPIMQEMKKAIGLDFMKIGNQANTDELVEGYLEELKLLFACHGSQYAVGEHHEHEDATKDSYANDTYINASLEKNGNYTISCEVVSVIPKETVKEVMGGLMGAITEGLKGKKTEDGKDHDGDIKDLDDEFKKEIDKAVETASKPNATNEECSHAGKVFSEMEGNELFNMIAERSQIIKRRMNALMELHMSNISTVKPISEKVTKAIEKKKLVVPENFKDFNIRDFV